MFNNICLSIYVYEYMFINICLSIYVYQYMFINICLSIYVYQYMFITICLSIYVYQYIIIIIIIIKRGWQCKAGRDQLTPYQSEDPIPTTPTHRKKEEKGKTVGDKKWASS